MRGSQLGFRVYRVWETGENSKSQNFKNSKIQKLKNSKFQKIKVSKFQKLWNFQKFKVSKTLKFSKIQSFKVFEIFKNSKIQKFKNLYYYMLSMFKDCARCDHIFWIFESLKVIPETFLWFPIIFSKIQSFKNFEISKIQNSKTLRTSSPNANRYLAQLAQLPIACVPRLLVASPLA